jgi:DNA-3-methyladenine glycosylase I
MEKRRCDWANGLERMTLYHDTEWGVPQRDDRVQFEFLILEGAQAGLSWRTILDKREGYRACFEGFDPLKVSRLTAGDVDRLMLDASIVRNRRKIESAVSNARIFLELAARHGSFSDWIWGFVDGRPVQNSWRSMAELPATTPLSDAVSKEMRRLGFKFMGSTVVYSHLQATGLVNDHLRTCFRHREVRDMSRARPK